VEASLSRGLERPDVAGMIATLHDEATRFFSELDGGRELREDAWERPGGGGGVSRVLADGEVFEKCGVNRSVVEGVMPAQMAQRVGARGVGEADAAFFVAGLSIVAHPRSPKVPTVHLNVRAFEITRTDGTPLDGWIGGGTDLTPTYPHAEDAIEGADVVMILRIQRERQDSAYVPTLREYAIHYGLTNERLDLAKKDAIVLHPGPMNRGIEIASDVADSSRSLILDQVKYGVAVRMAVLYLSTGGAAANG
jgi:coproporphyrinogen III oxidase